MGCVSQDSPLKKTILWEVGNFGLNHAVKFSKTTQKSGKKWSIAGSHAK